VLRELADKLGFNEGGPAAHELVFPEPPPEPAPPLDSLDAALERMVRRGATPEAVAKLRDEWMSRPLELGLAAWDILCTTLVDGAYAAELELSARPLWPILPAAGQQGIALEKMSPQTLASSLAARGLGAASDEQLVDGLLDHSIGAYHELRRRGAAEALKNDGTALVRTHRFALLLHRARLETLASFYLHYLWQAYGWEPAFEDLCEVLLDVGAHDRLPAEVAANEELATYCTMRATLDAGQAEDYRRQHLADEDMKWYRLRVEVTAKMQPKLRMAEAAIGMASSGLTLPWRVIDLVADDFPEWRFGARAWARWHSRSRDGTNEPTLDSYLARFGSDAPLWQDVFDGDFHTAWCRTLVGRATAELAAAPHVAATWRGLARMSRFKPEPIVAHIEERLRAQCARALGKK
jgi:hypothetical protein